MGRIHQQLNAENVSSTPVNRAPVRLALIGCGKFGRHHLRVLRALEHEGKVKLCTIIVNTPQTATRIEKEHHIRTHTALTPTILHAVDAVDITSPADTHYDLSRVCIPHAHVLCEKPVAFNNDQLEHLQRLKRQHGRVFMAGHIFRFNKAVQHMRDLVRERTPLSINVEFTATEHIPTTHGALHEFLHAFDIIDFLCDENPITYSLNVHERTPDGHEKLVTAHLTLRSIPSITLHIGWNQQKQRILTLYYPDGPTTCDLSTQEITQNNVMTTFDDTEPLHEELCAFLKAIHGITTPIPDLDTALRTQHTIEMLKKHET